MNLYHLRHFISVAEELSISSVAQKLGIAKSALSRQIKTLEQEVGWPLFKRHSQGLQLTPAGSLFLIEAIKIQQAVEHALLSVSQQLGSIVIRVGYASNAAEELIEKATKNFNHQFEEISVQPSKLGSKEMKLGLRGGNLDLIVDEVCRHEELIWHTFDKVQRYFIIPHENHLSKDKVFKIKSLQQQPLLFYSRGEFPSYWEDISNYLKANKIKPEIFGEFDGVESLSAALKANLGVGIMTGSVEIPENCSRLPAQPPLPPIDIGIAVLKKNATKPSLSAFIREFLAVCSK